MRLKDYQLILFVLLLISGCSSSAGPEPTEHVTASGLRYVIVDAGRGESPQVGQNVAVHYQGWLDGELFDSSLSRGKPFEFPVGIGRVIAGFDEGVLGMRVGGVHRLIIPPHLAYGEVGAGGVIPPNATLVYEVELISVADHGE
jgi:FKBP-type peptidyl-prolyl cis-trans isomerase